MTTTPFTKVSTAGDGLAFLMLSLQRALLQSALRRHAVSAATVASSSVLRFHKAAPFPTAPLSTLVRPMARQPSLLTRRAPQLWIQLRGKAVYSSTPTSTAKTSAERRQEMVAKGKSSWAKLKDLWQKYGIVAVGTYFTMYGVVLSSIYVAIEQGWVSTARPSIKPSTEPLADGEEPPADFNLVTATNKFVTLAEEWGLAKHMDLQRVNSKTGSFVIAWVATKFTEPLRLAITLAITPRIARLVGRAPKKIVEAATKA